MDAPMVRLRLMPDKKITATVTRARQASALPSRREMSER